MCPWPRLAWRSRRESNPSRESLRWTRSIRPVASSTPFDQAVHRFATRPGVAGVEAEPRIQITDHIPQAGQMIQTPGLGVVPRCGVLDQDRDVGFQRLQRLAPPGKPVLDRFVLGHVSPVDDDAGRSYLFGALHRVGKDLAAGGYECGCSG